jgi:TatD DNase family protein
MQLIDSHCHLYFEALVSDESAVLERAEAAGITKMINVGTSLADSQKAVDMASNHNNIWASVGVHPHEASEFLSQKSSSQELLDLLSNSEKVVAVGEIGLDYYKNHSPKEDQIKLLQRQIELGLPSGLPFIFHVRDAWEDFWTIFDEYEDLKGVVHSFASGSKQLEKALGRGLYVGLNGIMTFTRDEAQLEAARRVPADRLLLETDAPFLTPAPYRNQTCEPKHILTIAEFLAELRGEKPEILAAATTANTERLFGI